MSELGDLIDQYYSSPGYPLLAFINNGEALLAAHDANFNELVQLMATYNARVQSIRPKAGRVASMQHRRSQLYLRKFFRLIHNYCASLYTLDQNYFDFLVGKRNGTPFDPEAGKMMLAFRENPRLVFFFALRHYFTHHRIPKFQINVSNKRNDDGSITTTGNFTISKAFFLRELDGMADPEFVPNPAKFVYSKKDQEILSDFIKHGTPSKLSINILEQLKLLHVELISVYEHLNHELISKNDEDYTHSKELITEIIRRQTAI